MEQPSEEQLKVELEKKENDLFLKKTFETWYGENEFKVDKTPIVLDPRDHNFEQIKDNSVKDKFGEYTINPEMQDVDIAPVQQSIATLVLKYGCYEKI